MKCTECGTLLSIGQIITLSFTGHVVCKSCSTTIALVNRRFIRLLLVLLLSIFVLLNFYFFSRLSDLGLYGASGVFALFVPLIIFVLMYAIFVVPAMEVTAQI